LAFTFFLTYILALYLTFFLAYLSGDLTIYDPFSDFICPRSEIYSGEAQRLPSPGIFWHPENVQTLSHPEEKNAINFSCQGE
jgi:hypothetical protein